MPTPTSTISLSSSFFFFFFNDTATTEIYTLSLHDALPICEVRLGLLRRLRGRGTHADGRGDQPGPVVAVGQDLSVRIGHLEHAAEAVEGEPRLERARDVARRERDQRARGADRLAQPAVCARLLPRLVDDADDAAGEVLGSAGRPVLEGYVPRDGPRHPDDGGELVRGRGREVWRPLVGS